MVVWDNSKKNYFDFWVMEESWSKKFSVGLVFAMVDTMLGFWRGGELIVEDDDSVLVMYNVESRRMRRVHIHYPKQGYLGVFDYSKTLVSVTGEKKDGGTRERTEAVAQGRLLRSFHVQDTWDRDDVFKLIHKFSEHDWLQRSYHAMFFMQRFLRVLRQNYMKTKAM